MLLVGNIGVLPVSNTLCSIFEPRRSSAEPNQMTHIAHRGTSAAFVAAFLFLAGCDKPRPAMPAPEVTVAPVIDREVSDWSEFTGHFEPVQSVDVRPRVSGFIQHVSFPEGAFVR